MTFLPDLHSYLHQSSLLIQAYPTTRITTKYSLPRRPNPNSTSKRSTIAKSQTTPVQTQQTTTTNTREKRDPSATLTLKTFHPESGICLKYRTDKAQEVGRLMSGLGRLAKGEVIEMPSSVTTGGGGADEMVVDVVEDKVPTPVITTATTTTTTGGGGDVGGTGTGGGGGKKKKKGGKK